MSNSSGFGGYGFSNLYPGWGNGITQNMDTTPEPDEQASYTSIDEPAQAQVDNKSKMNIWLLLGGMVLLIAVFGRG